MKTHWKRLINPDYIGFYSLDEGKDKVVTIEKVIRDMVTSIGGKKEECTIAILKGEKPFILNSTNSKMIQKLYGTPYIEDWAGAKITLYASITKLKGEDVECLRIRPKIPNKKLPELTPTHKKWNGAIKALKDGSVTIDKIKESFTISEENEKLLLS